jgi:uroporphyrinogen decarboxylase
LDLDVLFIHSPGGGPPTKQIDEHTFLYGSPDGTDLSIWKFDVESHQFGVVRSGRPPLTVEEAVKTMRDAVARAGRGPQKATLSPFMERAAREYGDEFVIGGSSFMSVPMQSAWLEATLLEPELVKEHLDVIVENNLRSMARQREAGIRFFNGGGDFASNTGPIYSPRFFDEVMAPRWKRMFDWCREHDAWYVFRSDGNLWPVADRLFGWGHPHAYYEVDHDAGMHFDKLRARFPDLVLIGNVSCDVLQRGTAEEVRQFTLRCLEAAAPRVIIASANSLLHGTPRENVLAMYETAKKYSPTGPEDVGGRG